MTDKLRSKHVRKCSHLNLKVMKKTVLMFSIIFLGGIVEAADLSGFFNKSEAFFKKYVHDGKVAYKSIKANNVEIQSLYTDIETMNLASADEKQKKAFYANAYNLIVIYQVAKYYPLKSPLDQSGFFDKVKHKVAREPMTLNFLEIKKLILTYKDPRIHFALACAAKSCPPLANFAFMPDIMDEQLTTRTKLALNNKDWLIVKPAEKKVLLSKIFDWYNKDFTMNGENSVIDFVNKYRNTPIASNYTIGYYEYNWSLNEE
jgi:hypothetical protein